MFRAAINGRSLHLDNAGVRGGNEVYRDRETGSRWQQSTASAFAGPLSGTRLPLYPFLLTTWAEWRSLHPATLVLQPLPGYADRLGAVNAVLRQGIVGAAGPAPTGALAVDPRLSARTTVVGLELGDAAKAYPVGALNLDPVVNDIVGGTPVLIIRQSNADATTAFLSTAGGRPLHFAAARAGRLRDRETGSLWNPYGVCLAGKLRGAHLTPVILESEFWFAWSEFHPHSLLYVASRRHP